MSQNKCHYCQDETVFRMKNMWICQECFEAIEREEQEDRENFEHEAHKLFNAFRRESFGWSDYDRNGNQTMIRDMRDRLRETMHDYFRRTGYYDYDSRNVYRKEPIKKVAKSVVWEKDEILYIVDNFDGLKEDDETFLIEVNDLLNDELKFANNKRIKRKNNFIVEKFHNYCKIREFNNIYNNSIIPVAGDIYRLKDSKERFIVSEVGVKSVILNAAKIDNRIRRINMSDGKNVSLGSLIKNYCYFSSSLGYELATKQTTTSIVIQNDTTFFHQIGTRKIQL